MLSPSLLSLAPSEVGPIRLTDMTRLPSACAGCGRPFERTEQCGARCPDCSRRPAAKPRGSDRRGSPAERGYDKKWRKLSVAARRAQPWCTDCGRPDDLTADHSPAAWERYDAGLPIRLEDVDVVCRRCNSSRGAARGPEAIRRHTFGIDADRLDRIARTLGGDLDG